MATPRLNQNPARVDATRFDLNTVDDLLESEAISQDVVQRKRRVLGPAHPGTLHTESVLSDVRAKLASA